jgi:hypothetical protein
LRAYSLLVLPSILYWLRALILPGLRSQSLLDCVGVAGVDRIKGLSITRRFFSGVLLAPLYWVLISTFHLPALKAGITPITLEAVFSAKCPLTFTRRLESASDTKYTPTSTGLIIAITSSLNEIEKRERSKEEREEIGKK